MTDDLIECYSSSHKLMPFVHLPIQSGSNKILELMNRKHTVDDYLKIYERLKKINKEIEFSSDFIVGYPGETQRDFEDTFDLIKRIKFINSFSFIFSPRPGTKASTLKMIDKNLAKERLTLIQEKLFKNQKEKNKSLENSIVDVLVENKMEKQKTIYCGGGKKMNEGWLTVTVHIDKAKEYIFDYKGNKYLKLNINVKDQPDQYGKDVSLSVNTYEPEKEKTQQKAESRKQTADSRKQKAESRKQKAESRKRRVLGAAHLI